jgi:hypothetical protein
MVCITSIVILLTRLQWKSEKIIRKITPLQYLGEVMLLRWVLVRTGLLIFRRRILLGETRSVILSEPF